MSRKTIYNFFWSFCQKHNKISNLYKIYVYIPFYSLKCHLHVDPSVKIMFVGHWMNSDFGFTTSYTRYSNISLVCFCMLSERKHCPAPGLSPAPYLHRPAAPPRRLWDGHSRSGTFIILILACSKIYFSQCMCLSKAHGLLSCNLLFDI